MPPSRLRVGVFAAVLGLVAVLGIVWLVRSATTGGDGTSGERTNGTAEAGNGTGTGGDGGTGEDRDTGTDNGTDGGTDGGRTTEETGSDGGRTTDEGGDTGGTGDGGTDRDGDTGGTGDGGTDGDGDTGGDGEEGGRKSLTVNGLRIDGNGLGYGCVTILNKTSTPATIQRVSFTVVARPGPTTPALSPDTAHCFQEENGPGALDPSCDGHLLPEGGQCTAGAVPSADAPGGEYTVAAVAHYSFLCDNAEISPCNEPAWGDRPPTPQNPVLVVGRSEPLTTSLDVEGPPTSPPTSPSSPSSPAPE
ncbi:hypothetical protein [Streptomyces sp. JB150]|uniref:hypothetical protein n=1 Tax=Streptomyces sp. JB150 TaxID=2714844 RepID=UPI00140E97F1|nr:hypothetical protein [Streptomyces sp. JB150]QIJ62469.1 hypothetical protein G7Z13_10805 [Streptomyces sp. JB150]